ncbi:MAG TPA: glycosyltransferase family 39 protein, partial [Gemmatimonadaceae bacterium]|nr:glycosyltransferase family 39 protein [Gemmatimonadaceae bacterium]
MTGRARRTEWMVAAAVAGVTIVAFLPTLHNGFVAWDDDKNFLNNPDYRGLGLPQLRWMWTTFLLGHYVPLAWMSLGLDYLLWGMRPAGYHLTSLLIHAATAVLVFRIALRLLPTGHGRMGAAAFAALVFAVHPLRVESVAWATERRDVLCGCFYFAAVLSYLRYAAGDGRRWYGITLLLAACAMLSKGTAVTLPLLLAVLCVYPLRRAGPPFGPRSGATRRVLAELAPLIVMAALTGVIALVALPGRAQLGAGAKIAVSAYSLAFYIWK